MAQNNNLVAFAFYDFAENVVSSRNDIIIIEDTCQPLAENVGNSENNIIIIEDTCRSLAENIATSGNDIILIEDTCQPLAENVVNSENDIIIEDTCQPSAENVVNSENDISIIENTCQPIKDTEINNLNLENRTEINENNASHLNDASVQDATPTPISAIQDEEKKKQDNGKNKIIVTPFQCPLCKTYLSSQSARSRHLTRKHSIDRNHIHKCLECQLVLDSREELRQHLHDRHDLDMTPICLSFKNMDEFLNWKSNVQRETLSIYQKKAKSKSAFKYYCSRNGKDHNQRTKKDTKNLRLSRIKDSHKLGITCTAEIHTQFLENEIFVKYYPVHYGHGKDKPIKNLPPEVQSAVDELAEKGFDSEKLLEELSAKDSVEVNQMYPLRRRYLKWVRYAYKAAEYNTDRSDLECVSDWVKKCSDMEDCPVLFCLQENIATKKEKFILVIMTEFQKQIITSASKQVICIDVINRVSDAHLITVLVIDELQTAFPVAYCLSNKLNKEVTTQLYTCLKEHAGNLSPEYLMTNHNPFYFESWVEVMNCRPYWLWSRWETEGSVIHRLRNFLKKNPAKKRELFNTFQTILDCKSKDVAVQMFKSFVDKIQQDEKYKKLGEWTVKRLGSDIEKWAIYFQKEVDGITFLHLEVMHHVFFNCGTYGKGKKLYTFLCCIMRVLKFKILDRILNSFDDEKIGLAVKAIDFCHEKGLAFPPEKIFSLSSNVWMIDELSKVYVTQDLDKCPDHCSLRCKECEICVHQFSCSCVNSMIDANLCLHIHAIVYKFLRRTKSQGTSSDNFIDLEAINTNIYDPILDSILFESCVTSEVAQPVTDFPPMQASISVSVDISAAEDAQVQSAADHSSQVFISTPPRTFIPKPVSTKSRSENSPNFLKVTKSKDNTEQKPRSILKRQHESLTVETPSKKITLQLSSNSASEEMAMERTTTVPQIVYANANSSENNSNKSTISQKIDENIIMALNKTSTLSQILKRQTLSKDSLTAINKYLSECINIAIVNP